MVYPSYSGILPFFLFNFHFIRIFGFLPVLCFDRDFIHFSIQWFIAFTNFSNVGSFIPILTPSSISLLIRFLSLVCPWLIYSLLSSLCMCYLNKSIYHYVDFFKFVSQVKFSKRLRVLTNPVSNNYSAATRRRINFMHFLLLSHDYYPV